MIRHEATCKLLERCRLRAAAYERQQAEKHAEKRVSPKLPLLKLSSRKENDR